MERTYKFRLYPKRKQIDVLDRTLMLCRRLYNAGLEQRITAYYRQEKTLNYYDQQNELPQVKVELPEYNEVYSHALQDTVRRLDKAYRAFFRRVKNGETPGFPRFKGRNRFNSVTYDGNGFWLEENGHLRLTKVGTIRMFKHREIEGTPKTCIIKRDKVGDWYAIFTVEIPDVPKIQPKTAIGVDVGLKNLVVVSDGFVIAPPKFLRASEEKIKIRQREVSKKVKGSENRKKCIRRLAKVHRRVERQRNDYLHKASKELVKKADVIAFENLQINNMVKCHRFAKSISDAGWGKLMEYTAYKAEDAGKCVDYVNPRNTSQLCSRCGEMVWKSLSERFHVCSKCGFTTDRDYNASLNILGRLRTGSVELLKTPVEMLPLQLSQGGCK
jgi:putative transposase